MILRKIRATNAIDSDVDLNAKISRKMDESLGLTQVTTIAEESFLSNTPKGLLGIEVRDASLGRKLASKSADISRSPGEIPIIPLKSARRSPPLEVRGETESKPILYTRFPMPIAPGFSQIWDVSGDVILDHPSFKDFTPFWVMKGHSLHILEFVQVK
jgi:hypothetical protein